MTTANGSTDSPRDSRSKAPRIYLFDRDDDVRDSLKMLLESNGLLVKAFSRHSQFLTDATRERGDCIILAFNRLTVEELELLTALRRDGVRTPIILLDGGGDPSSGAASLRAGADAYLERPIEEAVLIRTVVGALPRRQALHFMGAVKVDNVDS